MNRLNYNDRHFRPIENSENGETSIDTIFHYKQMGDIITSEYEGGKIIKGHLLAKVKSDGSLEMAYHQINTKGELLTGNCLSTPEILPDGRIRLHEKWRWTSGDFSKGESTLEEIKE